MTKQKTIKGNFSLPELAAKEWWPPLILLILSVSAYGLLLTSSGVFGDDPEFLYTYYRYGAQGYRSYLDWQRPYAFWIYEIMTPLIKVNMPIYQLTTILVRWLSAWLIFINIKRALPDRPNTALWTAILFTIYPGFLQQPIAMAYLLHFTSLLLFLGSMFFMQIALESPNKAKFHAFSALSVIMMGGMFAIEYFVGWELLRPVLIWLKLPKEEPAKKRFVALLKRWLPYLLVLAGYLYWHLFIFTSKKYQPSILETMWSDPSGIPRLIQRILHDLWLAGVQVLGNLGKITASGRLGIASLAIGAAAAAALYSYFHWLKPDGSEEKCATRATGLIGAGIFAMLAGGPPVWFADIPMTLDYPWDRTTLCLVLGVCLLWTGIAYLLPRSMRGSLLSLLVGLSVAFHMQNINTYFKEWNQVRDIFWQLTWRAPGIRPGTMVMMDGLPTRYYPSNSYSSLLNWTYDPDASGDEQNYKIIEISQRLGNVLPSLEPGIPVIHEPFEGNTSKSIVIFKTSSGCLHVLRPADRNYRDIAPTLNKAMALTDENLILPEPTRAAVPPGLMSPEPEHGWCYYLEKAELARQGEDWRKVVEIAAEAESKSLHPPVPFDRAVFIEGYARLGDWESASRYLEEMVSQAPYYDAAVCNFLTRLAEEAHGGEKILTATARRDCGME